MSADANTLTAREATNQSTPAPAVPDKLLCRWLRGEPCFWPADVGRDYGREFVARCVREGVVGLLHVRCRGTSGWSSWPVDVREGIARHAHMLTAAEMLRTHALGRAIDALSRQGIDSLLLKGASLAYTYYPSPGLRERADEDLFIDLREIRRAYRVLSELGYEIRGTLYSSHQFRAVKYRKTGVESHIDVHWRISNSPRYARFLTFPEAVARSVRIKKISGHARGLGAVDALMLACVHRAANPDHDQKRLIWLYDIHLLAEALDAQQQAELVDLAKRRGTAAVCSEGISVAQGCFGTAFSDSAIERLNSAAAQQENNTPYSGSYLSLVLDDLRHLAGIRPRLDLVSELLFPPAEAMKERYGESSRIRLGVRYVWRVFRGGLKRLAGR